jgi:His/Glu/Gln/Arg/opine family amino acid ABC transporter permease subunit
MIDGMSTTLKITVLSIFFGFLLGIVIAIIRSTHDKMFTKKPIGFFNCLIYYIIKVLNYICHIYLTIIRGTPTTIQLMIVYFVIFTSPNVSKFFCAVVAFSINSGAYVAEIVRGGIVSVDKGQMEASRSLGFGYVPTMLYIILPQAFKSILPALGNEAIVLLKETSISGYIGMQDLTKAADIIRSRTYAPFMPLIGAALFYLIVVTILTRLIAMLERRLANNER